MIGRDLPRQRPGEPVAARTINRFEQAVEDRSRGQLLSGNGLALDRRVRRERGFFARLSGAASPYNFVEVYGQVAGSTLTWVEATRGRHGTNAAHEDNSVAGLDGKVARITPTETAATWRFQWVSHGCNPADSLICATVKACGGSRLVPGATVEVKDANNNVVASGTTNSSGVVCLSFNKPGPYTVKATGGCGTASVSLPGECGITYDPTITIPGVSLNITLVPECGTLSTSTGTWTLTGHGVNLSGTLDTILSCLPVLGDYTFGITGSSCYADLSTTVTADACTDSVSVHLTQKTYDLSVTVLGCNDMPLPGATVSVSGAAGSGGGTTDGSGVAVISGLKAQCGFSVTATKARFNGGSTTGTMACGNTTSSLTAGGVASGYFCWCNCADALETLAIVDGQGSHDITDLVSDCAIKTGVTLLCTRVGACNATYTGPSAYIYGLQCGPGTITLSRRTGACPSGGLAFVTGSVPGPGGHSAMGCSGTVLDPLPVPVPPLTGDCPVGGDPLAYKFTNSTMTEIITIADTGCPPSGVFNFTFGWSESATLVAT